MAKALLPTHSFKIYKNPKQQFGQYAPLLLAGTPVLFDNP